VSLLRRKPLGPVKRDPSNPGPDERIFGRHYRGPRPAAIGLVVAILFVAGFYLGFSKRIPFTSRGYELHATFENATTLKPDSPVRIAGVNVGKVISVEPKGNVGEATFTISDQGLPINKDATITLRPRLFLEGNFFLDLHPGSPSAPDLSSGSTIPMTQTATAVQIDEILTSLQSDSRVNLKRALAGYGKALNEAPTAAEDATQDPDVQGLTAGQAINKTLRYGGKAGRTSAIVNQALLGLHPHDLSNLIRGQRDLFTKLASTDGSLSDLITNFNTTAGALADESANLSASIHELAPTLQVARPSLRHLSDALPPFRALARESLPGIRELPATIRAGSPWLVQTGKLLRRGELGGAAKRLAAAAPGLAEVTHKSLRLFPQLGLAGRCVSHNLIPAGNLVVDDAGGAYPAQLTTGQPNFREFFYGVAQLAGESQGFDANGPFVRFQAGGGPELVQMATTAPGIGEKSLWGRNISEPLGTRPRLPVGGMPPFRMDVPCYTQAVPDLNGPAGAVGPPSPEAVP
jgi:phospholipid/cholesterol/gamma-HCH transport system substrate-binding protein